MITEALDLAEIEERRAHDLDIDRLVARVRELEAVLADATRAERERCIGILERHTTRTSADIVVNLDAVLREIEEDE